MKCFFMTKILSPKRWVGPPYYTSRSPFIARVEIDLLLILNKQSLQSKAWSSSNKYWTTLNVSFPEVDQKYKSWICHTLLRSPNTFPKPREPPSHISFSSSRHLPIPQLWDHLVFCASLRHTGPRPQETLSTVFNAALPSHPPPSMSTFNALPPSQCPQAKSRASPAGTKRLRARFGLISGIGAAGLNQDLARNLFQEILLKFPPILPTECCHGKRRGKKVSMFLQLLLTSL